MVFLPSSVVSSANVSASKKSAFANLNLASNQKNSTFAIASAAAFCLADEGGRFDFFPSPAARSAASCLAPMSTACLSQVLASPSIARASAFSLVFRSGSLLAWD